MFINTFNDHISGNTRTCSCGKTHYDICNDWDWEEGELEDLEKDKDAIPQVYSIGAIEINGMSIVIGCNCSIAKTYENFIITHSRQIAKYLNQRALMLKKKQN
jgi:hypothetical protein